MDVQTVEPEPEHIEKPKKRKRKSRKQGSRMAVIPEPITPKYVRRYIPEEHLEPAGP
jgi:hypothetical protein